LAGCEAVRVVIGLLLGSSKVSSLTLSLDDADEFAVDVQEVVGAADFGCDLTDRDSLRRPQILTNTGVLHGPACIIQHPIEPLPDLRLTQWLTGSKLCIGAEPFPLFESSDPSTGVELRLH
jgi:hypothetical protein